MPSGEYERTTMSCALHHASSSNCARALYKWKGTWFTAGSGMPASTISSRWEML